MEYITPDFSLIKLENLIGANNSPDISGNPNDTPVIPRG